MLQHAIRFAYIRENLASGGPRSSVSDWARELKTTAFSWRNWERKDFLPAGGENELSELLSKHRRCKSGEFNAKKLAEWAFSGGTPPLPGGQAAFDKYVPPRKAHRASPRGRIQSVPARLEPSGVLVPDESFLPTPAASPVPRIARGGSGPRFGWLWRARGYLTLEDFAVDHPGLNDMESTEDWVARLTAWEAGTSRTLPPKELLAFAGKVVDVLVASTHTLRLGVRDEDALVVWLRAGGQAPRFVQELASDETLKASLTAVSGEEQRRLTVLPAAPSQPAAFVPPRMLLEKSPLIPLVDAALAGRADPVHTLRMLKELIKAGLAALAVLLVTVPRAADADGSLPHGWRVLAGGSTHDASLAGANDAPQEEEPVSAINSKKWMPVLLMGRCA